MDTTKILRGIELRYVLTVALADGGVMTVPDLIENIGSQGFSVSGRSSKVVSDALRWEVALGRVERRDRNLYGPGYLPRSTEYRIRRRVATLRAEAGPRREDDDDAYWERMSRGA